jgi:hypothetical protein
VKVKHCRNAEAIILKSFWSKESPIAYINAMLNSMTGHRRIALDIAYCEIPLVIDGVFPETKPEYTVLENKIK